MFSSVVGLLHDPTGGPHAGLPATRRHPSLVVTASRPSILCSQTFSVHLQLHISTLLQHLDLPGIRGIAVGRRRIGVLKQTPSGSIGRYHNYIVFLCSTWTCVRTGRHCRAPARWAACAACRRCRWTWTSAFSAPVPDNRWGMTSTHN